MGSLGVYVVALLQVLQLGLCATFHGRIENVPGPLEVSRQHEMNIPNIQSLQNRFSVELAGLGEESKFDKVHVPVNKDFGFDFPGLTSGEYALVVNSYDFELQHERFRLKVFDNDTIATYSDPLTIEGYNKSSEAFLEGDQSLSLVVTGIREFYQVPQNTLKNMVLNSPFGFIFRSKLFTILFTISVAIMVTPYLLSWASPEIAEQLQEIQKGGSPDQKASQQVTSEKVPKKTSVKRS